MAGNTKIDQARLLNQTVVSFKSWGKHFLVCFEGFALRIHFLLFGSYRVNERKNAPVRLNLSFPSGELNLYSCSIKYSEGDIDTHYDISGCSSYYNKKWMGIFYPENLPPKEWFAYYCAHFNTYELNATFYKFPTSKTLHVWYKKSPVGFIFSVKAPKLITHTKKMVDCERELQEFYVACRDGLQDKLGCVLLQFPPGFNYSPERLERIIKHLSPEFKNVIEFRNESWWVQEVYDAFIKNQLIFCSVNYPRLPTSIIATHATGYVRLHGNPKLFYSEYGSDELSLILSEIRKAPKLKVVFIYFNNTASTAGILNALAVKRMSGERSYLVGPR